MENGEMNKVAATIADSATPPSPSFLLRKEMRKKKDKERKEKQRAGYQNGEGTPDYMHRRRAKQKIQRIVLREESKRFKVIREQLAIRDGRFGKRVKAVLMAATAKAATAATAAAAAAAVAAEKPSLNSINRSNIERIYSGDAFHERCSEDRVKAAMSSVKDSVPHRFLEQQMQNITGQNLSLPSSSSSSSSSYNNPRGEKLRTQHPVSSARVFNFSTSLEKL
jgi:hypothetical protein